MTKRTLIGLLIAAIAALVVYGAVRYYLPGLEAWVAAFLAGASGVFTFLGTVLDFVKKPLEVSKLWLENRKLYREAKEDKRAKEAAKRLVQPATPEEVKEYGKSYIERQLDIHYRQEAQEFLTPHRFIDREEEERSGG